MYDFFSWALAAAKRVGLEQLIIPGKNRFYISSTIFSNATKKGARQSASKYRLNDKIHESYHEHKTTDWEST